MLLRTARGHGPSGPPPRRLRPGPARRALRGWRRTRPFWAGALLITGGVELLVVPLAPWAVLVGLGLGGIAAIGIGAALTAAGLFLWLLPHTRHYVGIHAVILAVVSFAATNLGGFLLGALLGIAGGAMGFAWTPADTAEHRGPDVPAAPDAPAAHAAPDGATAADHAPRPPAPPKALAAVLPVVLLAAVAAPPRAERAPGPVAVVRTPPTVTTTRFAPTGFTLARVAKVRTADGPRKVMVLRMRAASLADYRLRSHDGGEDFALDVDDLRLGGDVTLYLTRFSGCVQGLVCLTFTPDTLPVPPVVPPFVFMTDVDAEQALVTSGTITADGLRLAPAPNGVITPS
ncbi:DUF6114 domain-containing protein [Streptomyces sp. NPDC026206]|uniref:DUF6114 domain-containing protein n=1 Tax=Streptomyces sp. NPDC026206 TaxID=3157089 RepID=UPI0034117E9C